VPRVASIRLRLLFPTAALTVACIVAVPVAPSSAGSGNNLQPAAACQLLRSNSHLRRTLKRVHVKFQRKSNPSISTKGPLGRVYYGRCGSTFYALASFSHRTPQQNLGTQDQPEHFTRAVHGRWRDKGDTGGDVCGTAPHELIQLWGFAACPTV
jgi:hypothetical protein